MTPRRAGSSWAPVAVAVGLLGSDYYGAVAEGRFALPAPEWVLLLGNVAFGVGVVARYRWGDATTRLQLRWVLYPVVVGTAMTGWPNGDVRGVQRRCSRAARLRWLTDTRRTFG